MRILVVDDARGERERLRDMLLRLGHEVLSASNGVEAIEAFIATRPDLVLLDVSMPVMDGLETVRRLRQLSASGWTPILLYSSSCEPAEIAAGIAAGGDDYLSAPMHDLLLAAKINAMQRIIAMNAVNSSATSAAQLSVRGAVAADEVDALSGFAVQAAGVRMLAREFSRCSRSSQPISLLLVSIDRYATVADAQGLEVADRCLRKLSAALRRNASRLADFGFRHGENVLAAILPDTPMTGAVRVAERIRSTVNEREQTQSSGEVSLPSFSISAGVATAIPGKGDDGGMLLAAAEGMLQQALDAGGDSVLATSLTEPFRLTTRELECLQWSALGKTSWEISCILEISEAAVNFHMTNIRSKFRVNSRRQAVALAIRYGLIRAV